MSRLGNIQILVKIAEMVGASAIAAAIPLTGAMTAVAQGEAPYVTSPDHDPWIGSVVGTSPDSGIFLAPPDNDPWIGFAW